MFALRLALAAGLALMAPALAPAGTPKNALGALAVAPNGQWIVAAGDNLTLYIIEAATMTVHSRHWIGVNPETLAFSADGATILVVDTDSTLTFLDAASMQTRATVDGLRHAAVLAGANQVVGMASQRRDGKAVTEVATFSLSDGRELMRTVAEVEGLAVGGSADGAMLALVSRPFDTTAETKSQPPADKKGLEKALYEQQNDAKASEALFFDAAGAQIGRLPLWFSSSSVPAMAIADNRLSLVFYDNENLAVDLTTGQPSLFEVGGTFNYGMAFSPDHRRVAAGGLAAGTLWTGSAALAFKTDQVGTWPEYFKGFAFAPDGTVYGGTTGYRLIRIGADGAVKQAVPVY